TGDRCTVVSLGPPSAADVLREALAWGADDAVLLSDPVFAGSDTLVTARALAALVEHEGPFDLVLVGRASLDAETGQVGPQLAELLGLPFASAVRELDVLAGGHSARLRCEQDDGGCEMVVQLPAVLATAERLCRPAKVAPDIWAAIAPSRVRRLGAGDLGVPGPWGEEASPTVVTALEASSSPRDGLVCTGSVTEQVRQAIAVLEARGALAPDVQASPAEVSPVPSGRSPDVPDVPGGPGGTSGPGGPDGPGRPGGAGALAPVLVTVLVEPARPDLARELLGTAARLAHGTAGRVVAVVAEPPDAAQLAAFGADEILELTGDLPGGAGLAEEDVAAAFGRWASEHMPGAVLAPATCWGREVASRSAVRLAAGLVGDALDVDLVGGRLHCTKPACGGGQLATVVARSAIQIATVCPGVTAVLPPRAVLHAVPSSAIVVPTSGRTTVTSRWCDDDLEALVRAPAVVGVGAAVSPDDYDEVRLLAKVLGAELGATRKVTDAGWLPRSRQIGITGRSISPRLYVAVGASGKLNHLIGVRRAGTVLAVNADASAPVFAGCDVGIVGDWRVVVRALVEQLESRSGS
ncbi:MAG: FAD-binding protein, partial [Acidimicrobiales bacterium]